MVDCVIGTGPPEPITVAVALERQQFLKNKHKSALQQKSKSDPQEHAPPRFAYRVNWFYICSWVWVKCCMCRCLGCIAEEGGDGCVPRRCILRSMRCGCARGGRRESIWCCASGGGFVWLMLRAIATNTDPSTWYTFLLEFFILIAILNIVVRANTPGDNCINQCFVLNIVLIICCLVSTVLCIYVPINAFLQGNMPLYATLMNVGGSLIFLVTLLAIAYAITPHDDDEDELDLEMCGTSS